MGYKFHFILEAVILGITLSMLLGPVFFSLLQTSIKRGFKAGIAFALGVLLSDLFIIILCYLGFSKLFDIPEFSFAFGVIGGLGLIGFGLYEIFSREKRDLEGNVENTNIIRNFFKAFVMNLFSPYVFMFWLGVMGLVTTKYATSFRNVLVFFIIALSTVFAIDVVKAFTANKLKKKLNLNVLKWVKRTVGVLLIVFGTIIVIRAFLYTNLKLL